MIHLVTTRNAARVTIWSETVTVHNNIASGQRFFLTFKKLFDDYECLLDPPLVPIVSVFTFYL